MRVAVMDLLSDSRCTLHTSGVGFTSSVFSVIFSSKVFPECCGVDVVLRCGNRSPDSGNSSLSEARLMPYCCRAVPPSPPLQIPCDGPAFGGRAGRVVRDHAGGFPVCRPA